MTSCFRNICAKNRQNPLIPFKVTVDNVGVPFLRHSVQAGGHDVISRNKMLPPGEWTRNVCRRSSTSNSDRPFLIYSSIVHSYLLKVKGPDIYIPTLTGKP